MQDIFLKILPMELRPICRHICDGCEEIRLRAGAPPFLVKNGREYGYAGTVAEVTPLHLEQLMHAACGGSG